MLAREMFQGKGPWRMLFGQNNRSYPSPSLLIRDSAFVAVEFSLRNILSSFPGSGPQSRLPTLQCKNALCYFLGTNKTGTMTHSGERLNHYRSKAPDGMKPPSAGKRGRRRKRKLVVGKSWPRAPGQASKQTLAGSTWVRRK